jgi:cytochrome c-type biogenesis protein CcmH
MGQEGRPADAVAALKKLLADLPSNSPWRTPTEQAIAEAERHVAGAEGDAQSGPTKEQIDGAASMSPSDQMAMIEGMVAQLDEKLRANPRDAEGWRRLVRSYQVLGKLGDARSALQRGMAALGPESEEARELEAFAVSIGLPKTE